jgi:hypothetical protein
MPYLFLNVQREHLLQQTLAQLSKVADEDLRKELKVRCGASSSVEALRRSSAASMQVNFVGEEGVDAGGVRKEFFQLLIQALFSEEYGMFVKLDNGDLWFNVGCSWSDEEYMLVRAAAAPSICRSQ